MTDRTVKLLLVDDHDLVRMGLRSLLSSVPGFSVVGEARSVGQALAEACRHHPQVVVMDLRLPDGTGVQACQAIRARLPETRIVMLTTYADEGSVIAAINAGAAGYVLKESEPQILIDAIKAAAQGQSLLDPAITGLVLAWVRSTSATSPASPLVALSGQEQHILQLIAEGKTNREIGTTLYLSEFTVKSYVSSIFRKLGVTRRSQAAALATRRPETPPLAPAT